jgi:hypothetical protein
VTTAACALEEKFWRVFENERGSSHGICVWLLHG